MVAGPWVVSTEITDWIGLAYDSLVYRADGGMWTLVGNDSTAGDTYYYTIAHFPSYTLIEFYLFGQDTSWWQNTGIDPVAGVSRPLSFIGNVDYSRYMLPWYYSAISDQK
ncbi:hypothetical protein AMJ83_02335 [candidate division WOR_3 bacterium SM23_42]|uniref:Uncharacterized protein n=1 Tax=candidate division WOR_3 bacterium SM23_42 TaxID=1703779 RepID=A0A0S8FV51_UNCW3|nr:MAG: hypothetical protein AMJ83_02335 [candidate division WOR_3 bacterium SM23_42]